MNELIEKVLEPIGITVNYLERVEGVFPQIVYNFKEYPNANGDNKEETNKYDIYFNLYIEDEITHIVKKIKDVLKEAKFIKIVINSPIKFERVNYYQVTMNYKKIMVV